MWKLASESYVKRMQYLLVQERIVDQERMRPVSGFSYFGSVLSVPFSALTPLVGWQPDRNSIHCATMRHVFPANVLSLLEHFGWRKSDGYLAKLGLTQAFKWYECDLLGRVVVPKMTYCASSVALNTAYIVSYLVVCLCAARHDC